MKFWNLIMAILTFLICSFQDRQLSTSTPKRVSLTTLWIVLPPMLTSRLEPLQLQSFCRDAKSIHLVFSTLFFILFSLHHELILSASFCNWKFTTWILFECTLRVVSSANRWIFPVGVVYRGISLIDTRAVDQGLILEEHHKLHFSGKILPY